MLMYTFHVVNIPEHCQTRKKIFPYLRTLKTLRIFNIFFNRIGDLFVQTPDLDAGKKLEDLEVILRTKLDIFLLPSAATYSCVIANVGYDIGWQDIRQHAFHRVIDVWRIRSKATDLKTTYVRVVFSSKNSRDCLVSNGLEIFGKEYAVQMPRFEPETNLTWFLKQANRVATPALPDLEFILSDSTPPLVPSFAASSGSADASTNTETKPGSLYSTTGTQTADRGNFGLLEDTVSIGVKQILFIICGVLFVYAWSVLINTEIARNDEYVV